VRRLRVLAVVVLAGCSAADQQETSTKAAQLAPVDSARLRVDGGSIWYRVTGTGTALPVVLLHGGPGVNSYYLKSMEALGDERAVIRYDQLGGGKSDPLTDTTRMTIAHFVEELEALRAHLGIEKFHVYGHSWGTILGLEYYRAHPDRVASLILASPAIDIPAWEQNARRLLATLPDSMQKAVAMREKEGKFEEADYQAAVGEFYNRFVWRKPVQADLDSTMASMNQQIYMFMQGPSEFTITGTLKQYNATGFLPQVKVPLLYTVGEFDEANPEIVKGFAAKTQGAQVAVIPGAAHLVQWDNPEENLRVVREFLRKADQKK
jgi:proline-specific peptidase